MNKNMETLINSIINERCVAKMPDNTTWTKQGQPSVSFLARKGTRLIARLSCDCMARFSCDDEAVCYHDFTTVQTQRLKQMCDASD